ncbi:Helicase-like [hydrothermal vent metagenome]|uniref:Helicase-like n=1 Tax=hydrothermal vent metagenome TaxID=652676 RepID=A0A1W1BNB1_9ZZZZ
MAKKNKKFTKINQKIKKFFDNDPFDVGIERVSSDTLSELMHTLGIYDIDYSKPVMIKTVRNLWSNADAIIREQILDFFIQNGKIYKSNKVKEPIAEKMEKINAFLEELDVSKDEAVMLYEAFRDVRSKKITFSKIQNRLELIRFEAKRQRIEDACDGTFDLHERFEFHAQLFYKLFGEEFHKIEVLYTKPYEFSWLKEASIDEIIQKIELDRKEAIASRQREIDTFLSSIKLPHKYLQKGQILHALKAASPTKETTYPPLKAKEIKAILLQEREIKEVKIDKGELFFVVSESITLPVTHQKLAYELEVYYPYDELLRRIWLGEELELERSIESAKKEHEGSFLSELELIIQESESYAKSAGLTLEEFYSHIYEVLLPYIGKDLVISPKLVKKTPKRFLYAIGEHIQKRQRQQLLAQTIRDFKNLFPLARSLRRKLTLHIGPTNSGKTYAAMQRLKKADTGYYLAPLRLLALEGYENLRSSNINASLITGEEQLLDPDATHISSTIEMLNYDVDVDVCVIDEVQLIDDRDRGWAWANAIIGAPAKEVILTGSPASKEAIIELANYLGEELEIIEFERKNPLTLLNQHTPLDKIEKGTALIAFSRKEVLKLKQKLSSHFSVSTVYGNLSPEVRREEARRFREGESDILVATDAIAMGMNLPIKTVLFTKAQKFDGIMDRELLPNEIKQIAGRAGRYGIEEEGFVGATSPEVLKVIKKNWQKPDIPVTLPFKVMANLDHIKLVSSILEENSLAQVLRFFAQNMIFSGPFEAANLEDMVEVAELIDQYDLDIVTKFHLATAPLTLSSPYILAVFESYLESLEHKKPIHYNPPKLTSAYALTNEDLLHAEDMVKEISLYLWLSYRFEEYFVDAKSAREHRAVLNAFIERSLQQKQFASRCKLCNTILPVGSKFRICDRCYKKTYKRGYKNRRSYRH